MRQIIAGIVLVLTALLLFARLGNYALWDDEAVTALSGQSVWKTGDTGVIIGHNIIAYRSGLLLSGMKERSTPPLSAYLVAPFVGTFGNKAWVARLPFAVIGYFAIGLILYWLYAVDASPLVWLLFAIALVCNVSLWLFMRQCRYYGPAIFSSIAIAYLYLNWNGGKLQLVLLAAASIVLLASNYLNFLALYVCMFLDYVIIGRKRKLLGVKDWLIVILPQVVIGGLIVYIWNTLGTENRTYFEKNTLSTRFMLMWMNLRDGNLCEFGAGALIVASPFLYFWTKNSWLIRAPLVVLIYVLIVSLFSPQVVMPGTQFADVRYLAPLIPLCITIAVLVLAEIGHRVSKTLAITIGVVAFGCNLFNGAPWTTQPHWKLRSTPILYAGELISPPPEPYTPTIDWIRKNVAEKETVVVFPQFMNYPLIFHAPNPVYAWQLRDPVPEVFKDYPPIHTLGKGLPNYVVAFGPLAMDIVRELRPPRGYQYRMVQSFDVLWADRYRPELCWHNFTSPRVNAA